MDTHRLLIVDDNDSNLAILSRCVARAGYEAIAVNNGAAALELIAENPPDLALIDWMMPGLSGLDLLAAIRASHSPEALPVIMCTARTGARDIQTALAAGANDFITKPINLAVAVARIEAQLSRFRATRMLTAINDELEQAVTDRTLALLKDSTPAAPSPDDAALREILRLAKWLEDSRDANDPDLRRACATAITAAAQSLLKDAA